jgi:hypothetical protein
MEEAPTDVQCRLTAEDVQQRLLTVAALVEAGHRLIVLEDQAVDSVAGVDLRVGLAEAEVTLPAVAAVMPQAVAAVMPRVVAAEDIAVAAVRTEAVTNSYFSPATYAVLRDGVFILHATMIRNQARVSNGVRAQVSPRHRLW